MQFSCRVARYAAVVPGRRTVAASPDPTGTVPRTGSGPDSPPDAHELAAEIRAVLAALVRRHRQDRTLPQPQVAAISWLYRKGPQTTSQLATSERVRPQSMASTVAHLESDGLIARRADEQDGRKVLIELTAAGRAAHEAYRDAGESWIATAVEERLDADERAHLAHAVGLLGRLVDE